MKLWTFIILVTGTATSFACMGPPPSYQVHLVNGKTGQLIRFGKVTVSLQAKRQCRQEHCQPTTRWWRGKSDTAGNIVVPHFLIKRNSTIAVLGFKPVKVSTQHFRPQNRLYVTLQPEQSSGPSVTSRYTELADDIHFVSMPVN